MGQRRVGYKRQASTRGVLDDAQMRNRRLSIIRTFNADGQRYIWQTRFLESVYRLGIRFRL